MAGNVLEPTNFLRYVVIVNFTSLFEPSNYFGRESPDFLYGCTMITEIAQDQG